MISAIGIVSIPLDLFDWHGNVFSVFSAFRVDVAVDILDLGRIAVRIIATANGRMIGHMPGWIEFLVQELILRWMVVKPSLALSVLRLNSRHQHEAKTARQEEFAKEVHCAGSLLRNSELREIAAGVLPLPLSGGVKPT
jgi:hypothetical protein